MLLNHARHNQYSLNTPSNHMNIMQGVMAAISGTMERIMLCPKLFFKFFILALALAMRQTFVDNFWFAVFVLIITYVALMVTRHTYEALRSKYCYSIPLKIGNNNGGVQTVSKSFSSSSIASFSFAQQSSMRLLESLFYGDNSSPSKVRIDASICDSSESPWAGMFYYDQKWSSS